MRLPSESEGSSESKGSCRHLGFRSLESASCRFVSWPSYLAVYILTFVSRCSHLGLRIFVSASKHRDAEDKAFVDKVKLKPKPFESLQLFCRSLAVEKTSGRSLTQAPE